MQWIAPDWWWSPEPVPLWLRGCGWMVEKVIQIHRFLRISVRKIRCAPCPVISVGGLVLGGSGKTPMTLLLGDVLQKHGFSPWILTRGYGGKLKGPLAVDLSQHTPRDVGEEALLLAKQFPTLVCRQRSRVLPLLKEQIIGVHAPILLLDDGHQHVSLHKDISLIAMTQHQKLGNGHVFPAGPLREPLASGLSRAHGILLLQDSVNHSTLSDLPFSGPVFTLHSTFSCKLPSSCPVLGFAGIGDPHRFRSTLSALFVQVKSFLTFPDHIFYTHVEEERLLHLAKKHEAHLVTTEKDWIKLSPILQSKTAIVKQILSLDHEEVLMSTLLYWLTS